MAPDDSAGGPAVPHVRHAAGRRASPALALAALGVVFGDIGTSPLYTLQTCFTTAHVAPTRESVLGIVSLLLWALIVVVCVKYVGVVLRVDHDGEGGILALLALDAPPKLQSVPSRATWVTWVVVIGTGMLVGDGMITPAISVLSALEGVDVATPAAHPFVVPLSIAILVALFAIQVRGTARIGALFGPVMALWFAFAGIVGALAILRAPSVLLALDPRRAIGFATHHGVFGFLVFGAVVLAVTGVEALYADLSHFGRAPIVWAWYAVVFPALVLNYLGEGAALLANPHAASRPFFALIPGALIYPAVALATAATVIASQALISGAYTLFEQSVNLYLLPRLQIRHTSRSNPGQVYVPAVNWMLAIGSISLVAAFGSSDRLAAAYGLAVSATMFATSLAFYRVVTHVLRWRRRVTIPIVALFVTVDATFFLASLPKFLEGAWIPIAISFVFVMTAMTWLAGRRSVSRELARLQMPVEDYLRDLPPATGDAQGTMVFLTPDPRGIPFIGGEHRWIRARAREERVVLMTFVRSRRPYVPSRSRVKIERLGERLTVVRATFGFMERPTIAPVLRLCEAEALHIDSGETSFFYADPKIVRARTKPLPRIVRKYFQFLTRNANPLPDDLQIRPERRVELGVEVAI